MCSNWSLIDYFVAIFLSTYRVTSVLLCTNIVFDFKKLCFIVTFWRFSSREERVADASERNSTCVDLLRHSKRLEFIELALSIKHLDLNSFVQLIM